MEAENLTKNSGNKKIVIISNFATHIVSGVYNVVENIAVHTNQLGYRCEIWGLSTETDQNNYPFYYHFNDNLFSFKVSDELKNKLTEERDAIACVNLHSVFTPVNIAIAKFVHSLNIPLSLTPHGGYGNFTFKRNYLKKMIFLHLFEKKYLRRMSYFFVYGKQEANFIKKYSSKTSHVLLNGFPERNPKKQVYTPRNTEQGEKLKVLFLGRLDPLYKGLDLLIEAINYIKDAAIEFTFAGPHYTEASQKLLEQLISNYGVASLIKFTGPVYKPEEKEALYSAHHLFIQPSRSEGMPTGVIEALNYGMPVLVSKGTNLAEIVAQEQFGLVIGELTPRGIADSIAAVCKDSQRLSEFAENAYTKSPGIFSWDKIAREYAESILADQA